MKIFKDSYILGAILGILAPVVGFLILKQIKVPLEPLKNFVSEIFTNKSYKPLLTGMLSVSLLANALVFTLFINTQKDKSAKGVFIATVIYGIFILIMKTLY